MSEFRSPDDAARRPEGNRQQRRRSGMSTPARVGLALAVPAIAAGVFFGGVLPALNNSSSTIAQSSQEVMPMVSQEDLATCPKQDTWDHWRECMEKVAPELLKHFDDSKDESKLSLADVNRWIDKFSGKDARVIFVYPQASSWSLDQIYATAAADAKISVDEAKKMQIFKVGDMPPEWQHVINTRELEKDVYSPFEDQRGKELVRVSLAPLDANGNIDMTMAGSGVFISCGNKHWLKLVTITSTTPVVTQPSTSTRITTTSTQPSTSTTLTSPPTSTTETTQTTSTTETTQTTETTTSTTQTTETSPPCEYDQHGNCKDYGNGVGSQLPPASQVQPSGVAPELEETSHPDRPSPTAVYTAPATTAVVVDPTITRTSSAPRTTQAPAPDAPRASTVTTVDPSGTTKTSEVAQTTDLNGGQW